MSAQQASPGGWNRPVRPGALLAVGATVLLVWLVSVSLGTWLFYEMVEARFTLRDQPLSLQLPAGMKAVAQVSTPVRTHVDFRPRVALRIDQPVRVHVTDSLMAHASINTTFPVDTTVEVDTVVPVKTTLDMSVSLKSWLPRVPVRVPVTLDLPVRMTVPIRADVPVALDLDVVGELPRTLVVPVRGNFVLHPHVKGDVDVRMNAMTLFSLTEPLAPFGVRIAHAAVRVPFNLTLHHRSLP